MYSQYLENNIKKLLEILPRLSKGNTQLIITRKQIETLTFKFHFKQSTLENTKLIMIHKKSSYIYQIGLANH